MPASDRPALLRPGSVIIFFHITTGDTGTESPESTARRLQDRLSDYFTSTEGLQFHGARFPVSQIGVQREWTSGEMELWRLLTCVEWRRGFESLDEYGWAFWAKRT